MNIEKIIKQIKKQTPAETKDLQDLDQGLVFCYSLLHERAGYYKDGYGTYGFNSITTFEGDKYWEASYTGKLIKVDIKSFKQRVYEGLLQYLIPEDRPHKVNHEFFCLISILQGFLIRTTLTEKT